MFSVTVAGGSRAHSRTGSAANTGDLDDIFARLEPGGDTLGRIDDDSPLLSSRSQGSSSLLAPDRYQSRR